jgi:hypothetical protein
LTTRPPAPNLVQTLTVANNGSRSGTVTSEPAGIKCGATCVRTGPVFEVSQTAHADPELELHPAARARDEPGSCKTMMDPTGHPVC